MLNEKQLKAIINCEGENCEQCELFEMNKPMICSDHIEIAKTALQAQQSNLKIIEAVGFCILCKNKHTSTSMEPCYSCKTEKYRFELDEKLR